MWNRISLYTLIMKFGIYMVLQVNRKWKIAMRKKLSMPNDHIISDTGNCNT